MQLAFFCALLLVIGSSQAAEIFFNNTVNCNIGCAITDPTIYEGGMLPTAEDEVYFNVTSKNSSFTLPANSTFNATAIYMWNTSLALAPMAVLSVPQLSFVGVALFADEGSAIIAEEVALEESTVSTYGVINVTDFSAENTNLYAFIGSTTVSESFDLEGGTVLFYEGSSFNSSDSGFSSCSVTYYIVPALGEEAEFDSVTANFPVGFIVTEEFQISESNFTAWFPDALANVSLVLSGKNILNISNVKFGSNLKFNQTTSPFITFQVSNNATFNGSLSVPGQIVVNSGSNVHFAGNISLTGGIQAAVVGATQIDATGILQTGAPISLVGQDGNNSFSVSSVQLRTPSLILEKFVLLSNSGTTNIQGDLINNGSIYIFENSNIIVGGNYTQLPNTTFGAFDLTKSDNRPANLYVNGVAHLAGYLHYNSSETKKSFTATVLASNSTLLGAFDTNVLIDGDVDSLSPKLTYTANTVQISINPKGTTSWMGLFWWIWLIIGLGALALAIMLIAFIVTMRRRAKYEAVRN